MSRVTRIGVSLILSGIALCWLAPAGYAQQTTKPKPRPSTPATAPQPAPVAPAPRTDASPNGPLPQTVPAPPPPQPIVFEPLTAEELALGYPIGVGDVLRV